MLIFYIARQLESTEMQILLSLKMGGKKSASLKGNWEAGWSEEKVINKSNPDGWVHIKHKFKHIFKSPAKVPVCECTYELRVLSFWGFCLEPCGSWRLSSWVSPHPRVHAIELCSGMFSLPPVFSFPSFCPFFPSWKQLVVWWTEFLGATGNINWVQPYLCTSVQSL